MYYERNTTSPAQHVTATVSGLGLPTILTLIFMTLKLCGVITWSWWWVFSPLWISTGIVILFLIIFLLVIHYVKKSYEKRGIH